MKVDFDGNKFTASMSGFNESTKAKKTDIGDLANDLRKKSSTLILGILAIIAAFALLPIGLIINACTDILYNVFGFGTLHYIFMICMIGILILVLSVMFSVICILSYNKRHEKATIDTVGFVLAITSFVISGISVIANIFFIFLLF